MYFIYIENVLYIVITSDYYWQKYTAESFPMNGDNDNNQVMDLPELDTDDVEKRNSDIIYVTACVENKSYLESFVRIYELSGEDLPNFNDIKEICKLAVKKLPWVFVNVSPRLKADREFALFAVGIWQDNFLVLDDCLKYDVDFYISACEQDPQVFSKVNIPFPHDNEEFILDVLRYNPSLAVKLPFPLRSNVKFAIKVVEITKFCEWWKTYNLSESFEFASKAIKCSPTNIRALSISMLSNQLIVNEVYNLWPGCTYTHLLPRRFSLNRETCCTVDDECDICLDLSKPNMRHREIDHDDPKEIERMANLFINPRFKHSFYRYIQSNVKNDRSSQNLLDKMGEITGVTFTHTSDYNNYILSMENSFGKAKNAYK